MKFGFELETFVIFVILCFFLQMLIKKKSIFIINFTQLENIWYALEKTVGRLHMQVIIILFIELTLYIWLWFFSPQ